MKNTTSLRVLFVLLSLSMALSLFACGEENTTTTDGTTTIAETKAETEESVQETIPQDTDEVSEVMSENKETTIPEKDTTETEEGTTETEEGTTETEEGTTETEESTTETETDTTETETVTTETETSASVCEHEETQDIAAVAATCTEAGLTAGKKCKACGEITVPQTTVAALGHDMATDAAVAPTCTEKGLTEGSHCSRCDGATTAQTEIAALGHTWDAGMTATDVACGATADVTYKCTVEGCDGTKTETGERVTHSWEEASRTPATCSEKGSVSYKCNRGECTETKTEALEIDTNAHDWNTTGTQSKAPTCSAKGETTYTCKHNEEHKNVVADIDIIADAHDWNTTGTQSKAPTCSAKGETTYTCKHNEAHTKTEADVEIDPTAHKAGAKTDAVAATCTTAGSVEYYTCEYCSKKLDANGAEIADVTVASTGHKKVDVAYIAATTAETGFKAHKSCENCDAVWTTEDAETTVEAVTIPKIVSTTNVYLGAEELSKLTLPATKFTYNEETLTSKFNAPQMSEDRTYVRFSRGGLSADGYISFIAAGNTAVTGQYMIIKYRTDNETYFANWARTDGKALGTAGTDDNYNQYIKNDGKWHILVIDLASEAGMNTVAKNSDGKYVINVSRIDLFDPIGEKGYFDIAYVAYADDFTKFAGIMQDGDNNICEHLYATNATWDGTKECYTAQCACGQITKAMLHVTESESINGAGGVESSGNFLTATADNEGFVTYKPTTSNTNPFYYIYRNGSVVTGRYIVIKYRLVNDNTDTTISTSYSGSLASGLDKPKGEDANTGALGTLVGDGKWHYLVVELPENNDSIKSMVYNEDGTFSLRFLRITTKFAIYDGTCYLDIDSIAFADCEEACDAYVSNNPITIAE